MAVQDHIKAINSLAFYKAISYSWSCIESELNKLKVSKSLVHLFATFSNITPLPLPM